MAGLQAGVPLVLIFISKLVNARPYKMAFKCCDVYEHFDSSYRCTSAPWPRADVDIGMDKMSVVGAMDESWTSRWYPPGPPRSRLVNAPGYVVHSLLSSGEKNSSYPVLDISYLLQEYGHVITVNRSRFFWDIKPEDDSRGFVDVYDARIVRHGHAGGSRFAIYCVDAIQSGTASYVVVFRTIPTENDLFSKCCGLGEVVVTQRAGELACKEDWRAWTDPSNASLWDYFDSGTPFRAVNTVISKVSKFMLIHARFQTSPFPPDDIRPVKYISQFSVEFLSSTWMYPCVDLERHEEGDVSEVLGYFVVTRHTRAAYLITRNLSFVSALILVAALVAIGCKERMRSSAHGWALGCHIVCLLLFNIGQIVYYLTMSAEIEKGEPMNTKDRRSCLGFAIPMYFLLTAATAWMTAVSANMFFGFKIRGGPRASAGDRKRFLKLSAFAWGVAATLTGVSVAAFLNIDDPREVPGGDVQMLKWYQPTFAETRTCYSEIRYSFVVNVLKYRSQKLGTTLYYYVPTLALVAANGAFLWLTGRKVRYLRRGNSLLKRDEREGGGRRGGGRQQDKGTSEPKSVTVYIKLLLAGGVLEFLAEALAWSTTSFQPWTDEPLQDENIQSLRTIAELMTYQLKDYMYVHRITGYLADFFRALVVLWLAVPEPADLRAAWRRMRGVGGDSPAAPRPAVRPGAGRRGGQGDAL